MPVDLGQEPGEVELVGAGGAGGFEVGARPVAGFRGEARRTGGGPRRGRRDARGRSGTASGCPARPGCRRRPSSGRRSRRRASGRAPGRRREAGGSRLSSAARTGGRRRCSRGSGRCSSSTRTRQLMRSSVQIACSRPWNGVSFFSASIGHAAGRPPRGCCPWARRRRLAGDLLHRDQADRPSPGRRRGPCSAANPCRARGGTGA